VTSQRTLHANSQARPALPATWPQRWRAHGPTAQVQRSTPSAYYCGSSHRTSGPSQGWTCSGTRGRWVWLLHGVWCWWLIHHHHSYDLYYYYDLLLRQLLLLLLLLLLAGGRRWAAASAQEGMAAAAVRAARGLLARAARAPPWHAGGVRPPAQAA
jgi:hypothetical protein